MWLSSLQRAKDWAAQIQKTTTCEAYHLALDVADSTAVTEFFAAVGIRFGRFDICVTNSAGPPSNLFESTPPEAWRSALGQLLMSTIYFVKEVLPRAEEQLWTLDYD